MEEHLNRLDREMADIAVRVRNMETFDTSYQRDVLKRIDNVSSDLKTMRDSDTDTNLRNLAVDVTEIKDEMKATRFLIRTTLATAAIGIVLTIIEFALRR